MSEWPGVSESLPNARLRSIGLGAGVQSSTLALMAGLGEIGPMPDCAFFADTTDEPEAVYRHLAWLETQLPFPVHRIRQPLGLEASMRAGHENGRVPFYIKDGGLKRRQCTRDWKIRPIRRAIREVLGVGARGYVAPNSVEHWIGISTDEIERMHKSGCSFVYNRHPLIELRMSRRDCERWLTDRQYRVPPKSACRYCPFTNNARWADMKANAAGDFARAVSLDTWLREPAQVARYHGETFVHRDRRPLADVDFSAPETGPDLFECEGMCGV